MKLRWHHGPRSAVT